jgi:hypothetical protein
MLNTTTLKDTEMKFYGDQGTRLDEIRLVVYVVYKGDKRDNGCGSAVDE